MIDVAGTVLIQHSPFDSDILDRRIGRYATAGLTAGRVGDLRRAMSAQALDLVFIKDSAFPFERAHALPWEGLELADVKVVLGRATAPGLGTGPGGRFTVDGAAGPGDAVSLRPLVRPIAVRSRFARVFGEARAVRLYDAWLDNSLARQAADWVFVARAESGEPAGVVTVARTGSAADLALVSTAEAFRGRGVLRVLATAALDTLHAHGVAVCTVATQLANREALRAYEALGFRYDHTVVDLHLHSRPR